MFIRRPLLGFLLTATLSIGLSPVAFAFIINPGVVHWATTASGSRTANGDPATLTWSIVPDGTSVPDGSNGGNLGPSDLIAFLDGDFGAGPGGSDLTQRPWFHLFEESFGRWGELSGATYVYEPADDGLTHSTVSGVLGVRGDLRIAGAFIDGASSTLAFNYLPDNGDMVLDTGDGTFFGNATNNHRALRDTIMHEHGHGFGLQHVESNTDNLLMEPFINTSFDGPQLDEVRAVQFYFGDANEKSNGGLGNDTAALATDLGTIALGSMVGVGSDADVPSQFISPTATDFVSITNLGDTDFYAFTVSQATQISATLTPRGGQFNQASEGGTPTPFDASARSDLSLTIFDTNGISVLASVDQTGQGVAETLAGLSLPGAGQYFARIVGADDTIQLYELELTIANAITFLEADFNTDGNVDDQDLAIWQAAFGVNATADANGDGTSDGADFLVWQQQVGSTPPFVSSQSVPEPSSCILLILAAAPLFACRRR